MCTPQGYAAHQVRTSICSFVVPCLIAHPSSREVHEVYQRLLDEQRQVPTSIAVLYHDRHGALVNRDIPYQDFRLRKGVPIASSMMNMVFDIFLSNAAQRVQHLPSMPMDREEAFQWVSPHPPDSDWRGFRLIPLSNQGVWSLLLEEYRGPESNR